MKEVKLCFIAAECAMILGVFLCTFLTDWQAAEQHGMDWMYRCIIVGCSICAVVFQREQQDINLGGK